MYKVFLVMIAMVLAGAGCTKQSPQTPVAEQNQETNQAPTIAVGEPNPNQSDTTSTPQTKPPVVQSAGVGGIKIYMIDFASEGTTRGGKVVGCGDSAVAVVPGIPTTTAPLTAAIKAILAVPSEKYGQTGLFNPAFDLGKGSLKFVSATVKDGLASIYVTGETSSGGICADARFQAQFEETAKQFPTVQKVDFYVNGKKFFGEGVRG